MDNFVFGYSDGLEAVFAVVIVCRATSSRLPNASPTQEVQRNDADDRAPPQGANAESYHQDGYSISD
jgi:hypothetical protein